MRQQRLITDEINAVTQSIERERRLVPNLETLRAEFQLKLADFEKRMKTEKRRLQNELDVVEAGPSREVPSVPVVPFVSTNRQNRQWHNMTRDQRAVKRSKTRENKANLQSRAAFKYYGRGPETTLPRDKIMALMRKAKVMPAQRFVTMNRYFTVGRRLILRNLGEVVENNGQIELI